MWAGPQTVMDDDWGEDVDDEEDVKGDDEDE
jgi:hypothetical protein